MIYSYIQLGLPHGRVLPRYLLKYLEETSRGKVPGQAQQDTSMEWRPELGSQIDFINRVLRNDPLPKERDGNKYGMIDVIMPAVGKLFTANR